MKHSHRFAAFAAASMLALPATAQIRPTVLSDVDPTPTEVGSNPEFGAVLPNGVCVFAATDLTNGREVWRTNGNSAPTLLKDIIPGEVGSHPTDFVLFQNEVWFVASDDTSGREIWKTNGTTAGTVLVLDLEPGQDGSAAGGLTVCNGLLFFTAFETGAGREPHVTDGTLAGTTILKDIFSGIDTSAPVNDDHKFVCCDGEVYFPANDGINGDELWKSDGTPSGTVLIKDLNPGPGNGLATIVDHVCCNDRIFFQGDDGSGRGRELCVSNGTAAGTRLLADIRAGSGSGFPNELACHNGELFFSAVSSNQGRELFKSNGTTAGTVLLIDLRAGTNSSNPRELQSCGNLIYFQASSDGASTEPHVTDGTAQGTRRIGDINPGVIGSLPRNFVCCDNLVFFVARPNSQEDDLYVTTGVPGSIQRVADLFSGEFTEVQQLFCCVDRLLFSAEADKGREFFSTDGTGNGTSTFDLEPATATADSRPRDFVGVDLDTFYFIADTTLHGSEVFFFDGTRSRPVEVNIGAADSRPEQLTIVGDTAYFVARDAVAGAELFRSTNGGPAELVADLRPGGLGSFPNDLIAFDSETLVCGARTPNQGTEFIVVRNGVPGAQIIDIRPGTATSSPRGMTRIIDPDTGIPFIVFNATDGVSGNELFVFDGTDVTLGLDIETGRFGSGPTFISSEGSDTVVVLQATQNGSRKLFSLTVTSSPTSFLPVPVFALRELSDLARSFSVRLLKFMFREFTPVGFLLFVAEANFRNDGEELFDLDANGNPHAVGELNVGPDDDNISWIQNVNDLAFYNGETKMHGKETFLYDPTTRQVVQQDTLAGSEGSNPGPSTVVGNTAFFSGSTVVSSEKAVLAIRGPAGPQAVFQLGDVDWQDPVNLGNKVVFGGKGPGVGNEVQTFTPTNAHATNFGSGCGLLRTASTIPTLGSTALWKTSGIRPGGVGFQIIGPPAKPPTNFAGCNLYLDLQNALTVNSGSAPSFTTSVIVSNDTALIGVQFVLQSASFDGSTFETSNGVYQQINKP